QPKRLILCSFNRPTSKELADLLARAENVLEAVQACTVPAGPRPSRSTTSSSASTGGSRDDEAGAQAFSGRPLHAQPGAVASRARALTKRLQPQTLCHGFHDYMKTGQRMPCLIETLQNNGIDYP